MRGLCSTKYLEGEEKGEKGERKGREGGEKGERRGEGSEKVWIG